MNRNKQCRAGDQVFVVHVARMHPWRPAAYARRARGCDSHAAEKRMQRYIDARSKLANHVREVQRDHLGARVWKIVGQKAAPGSKAIAGKWYVDLDFLDLNFENVSRFRLLDRHRPGENMTAGT